MNFSVGVSLGFGFSISACVFFLWRFYINTDFSYRFFHLFVFHLHWSFAPLFPSPPPPNVFFAIVDQCLWLICIQLKWNCVSKFNEIKCHLVPHIFNPFSNYSDEYRADFHAFLKVLQFRRLSTVKSTVIWRLHANCEDLNVDNWSKQLMFYAQSWQFVCQSPRKK